MPELGARALAAYGVAQELTKQLITLATAVFALTLTFADQIARPGRGCRTLLEVSWVLFLVSVGFGLLTLMALAGQIAEPGTKTDGGGHEEVIDSITTWAIRTPALVQALTFAAALVLTLIYGFEAV
jgi:hypothetical protein